MNIFGFLPKNLGLVSNENLGFKTCGKFAVSNENLGIYKENLGVSIENGNFLILNFWEDLKSILKNH